MEGGVESDARSVITEKEEVLRWVESKVSVVPEAAGLKQR